VIVLIRVVASDGDVVHLVADSAEGEIEVITTIAREGNALILRGAHIEGPGIGSVGMRVLRELARELARQYGVDKIVVFGGRRTTGANPGHIPRPIVIEVR
jgi:filamentous hemagglutinin